MIKEVRGIVLTGMKYRESGKILRVFTKERGIISVLAQGVYRKNSVLYSVTESFAECLWDFERGKSMYYVRSAELVDLHYPLRQSYPVLFAAQKAVKYLIRAIPEEVPQPRLYELFAEYLRILPSSAHADRLASAFLLKMAANLGYQPYLFACAHCGNRKIRSMTFSQRYRGILCENCRMTDQNSKPFSKEMYVMIYRMLHDPLELFADENGFSSMEMPGKWIEDYVQSVLE